MRIRPVSASQSLIRGTVLRLALLRGNSPARSASQSPDSGNGLATLMIAGIILQSIESQSPDSGNGLATPWITGSPPGDSSGLNPLIRGTVLRRSRGRMARRVLRDVSQSPDSGNGLATAGCGNIVSSGSSVSLNPLIRGTVLRHRRSLARTGRKLRVSIP